jgi:hypothetical protein
MTSVSTAGYLSDRFNAVNSSYEAGSSAAIPNVQNSANISFSLWVNPLNLNDYYPAIFSRTLYLFDNGSSVGKIGNYLLYLEPSPLDTKFGVWMECHQGGTSPNYTDYEYFGTAAIIDVSEWSHIVVTVEGTDAKMYINGALSASKTLVSPMVAVTANDPVTNYDYINDVIFGESRQVNVNNGITSDYLTYTGFIDDIFIYNRALTAAEVTTLYTLPQNPTPAGTASINEQTANLVNVYPNPTADFMQVELTAENESSYNIYSADNREVMNGTLSTGNNSIDVQTLAAGTYFLKTTINGSVVTKKITKQ